MTQNISRYYKKLMTLVHSTGTACLMWKILSFGVLNCLSFTFVRTEKLEKSFYSIHSLN